MYIFIETITGLKIQLNVESEDTIRDVKQKIMIYEDLPIDDQHLIYQEKDLENFKTLKDYNILQNATLKLIMTLRGGPLSTEVDYEELLPKSNSDRLSDKLAVILFEDGELRFIPICGLEMQSKLIKQTKNDLRDPSIFAAYKEPPIDQKLTILKLKMDCVRLGKKLSTMSRQPDNSKSISVNKEKEQKSLHPPLHRSVSLDSKKIEFVNDSPSSTDSKNTNSSYFSSQLPFGIYRTMSFLDTIKYNKHSTSIFPPIHSSLNSKQKLNLNETSLENHFAKSNSFGSRRRLPPLNESEYENRKGSPRKPRCVICSKKMSLTNEFSCRCGGTFCSKHRYPEEHSCTYDYKYHGKLELFKSNPLIQTEKIPKIQ